MKIAVGVCGLTCSGKDTVIEILSENYGFKKYSYTDLVLKPVSDERNLPHTRDSYRKLLTDLGQEADRILFSRVQKENSDRAGIPNIRMKSSINFWKNKSGYKFYLIKVEADLGTRHERWIQRKREIDKGVSDISNLSEVDKMDMEVNDLGEILKKEKFDFVIINNGTVQELNTRVEEIVKKILS